MGGPKLLLELAGEPLVRLHVERALAHGCTRALVIVRPEWETSVKTLLARGPCAERVQVIAATTTSQASSLATLVRTLRLQPDLTFLITPVDAMPCSPATHHALHMALTRSMLAATPRFRGRGGHPVLVRSVLLERYLSGALAACPPLREVLAVAGEQRVRVDVPDASVVTDVDTPADAHALGLRFGLMAAALREVRGDVVRRPARVGAGRTDSP
jgi:molybdenum cofactor cytidylyltransferase